ncbi:MAG: hypothetical protein K8L99_23820 [Anaerolineae bacterium]|nr:hypothetical protein [Anaerolineae bacterium]
MTQAETRAVKLVDIPLVKRLVENGTILDSETGFTRAMHGPNSALFSNFFLPQRGLHTLMARCEDQYVVGQFRLRPDETHARMIYIAPGLDYGEDDTAWLHVLDAMVADAGRRGAHMLTAEVDEHLDLFETLRVSGFAIYARQEIWQRAPAVLPDLPDILLTQVTEADEHGIHLLYSNVVPRLVQQIAMPPSQSDGLVYRKNERVEGYIAISEGKHGIYLMPYLHPDVFSEAVAIIGAAMRYANNVDRLPVYVCVRRYQDWLEDALVDLGFEPMTRQAVMVRHIAAGIRQTSFATPAHKLEVIPSPIKPPTATEPVIDHIQQNQE